MFVRVGKLAEVYAEVEPKVTPSAGHKPVPWAEFRWDKETRSLEVWLGRVHVIWSSLPVKTRVFGEGA